MIEKESFIGVIEQIENDNALVIVEEGEIMRSGNEVIVDLSVAQEEAFLVGDWVNVAYDVHAVRESNPLGIDTIAVQRIEAPKNSDDARTYPSFTGEIKEIIEKTAIVESSLAGKVAVNLAVNYEETFQVGDTVRVYFTGEIRESNPAQIDTLAVEKINKQKSSAQRPSFFSL